MGRLQISSAVLATAMLFAEPALAGPAVGGVSRLSGEATGEIEGTRERLLGDSTIFLDEIVATEKAARLEIVFEDTTRLTLGERAKVRIDRFVFDGGRTSRLTIAATGALRFVSSLQKASGAEIVVRTPVATIGIRGTDFWAGPIDGQFGVLLIEGAVSVANPAGEAVLDAPGEGTNIAGPDSAPGPVTQWPQQKVDRALAAVAF
jgi:hypothetical protein